jgi:HEPN domain-containing protein
MSINNENIDLEKLKEHFIQSSDKNYETMLHLFESKDLDWSLFVGHLVIEKLLKAIYISVKKQYPPYIHNLLRLAELSEIQMDDEASIFFSTVTGFNINARYDDYKESFYKKCTPEFTGHWINLIKKYRTWIKNLL